MPASYKQLIHSPLLGGGVFTAISVTLFKRVLGFWGMLGLTTGLALLFFAWAWLIRGQTRAHDRALRIADLAAELDDESELAQHASTVGLLASDDLTLRDVLESEMARDEAD